VCESPDGDELSARPIQERAE